MRVFNAAVANDHAVYDACLVRSFPRYTNWTHVDFTQVPVGVEHFTEDTRGKVVAELRRSLSLPASFGSGNKAFVATDIAFRMVGHFGGQLHAQRKPIETVTDAFVAHLRMCANEKTISLLDMHPLAGNHRARNVATHLPTEGGGLQQGWKKVIDLQKDEQSVVATLAQMERGKLLTLLRDIQPLLMDFDDTHIQTPLLDLRQAIIRRIENSSITETNLWSELIGMVYAHWKEHLNIDDIERANEDLVKETGDPKILDAHPKDIMRRGFIEPMEREQEPTSERRAQLLRRKIILESLYMDMLDKRAQHELNDVLAAAYNSYVDKLGMRMGELGYLGVVNTLMTDAFPTSKEVASALH